MHPSGYIYIYYIYIDLWSDAGRRTGTHCGEKVSFGGGTINKWHNELVVSVLGETDLQNRQKGK